MLAAGAGASWCADGDVVLVVVMPGDVSLLVGGVLLVDGVPVLVNKDAHGGLVVVVVASDVGDDGMVGSWDAGVAGGGVGGASTSTWGGVPV